MATEENPLTRGAKSNFIERAYFEDHNDVSGGVVTGFRDTLRQVLDSAALLAAFGFPIVKISRESFMNLTEDSETAVSVSKLEDRTVQDTEHLPVK